MITKNDLQLAAKKLQKVLPEHKIQVVQIPTPPTQEEVWNLFAGIPGEEAPSQVFIIGPWDLKSDKCVVVVPELVEDPREIMVFKSLFAAVDWVIDGLTNGKGFDPEGFEKIKV